MYVASVLSTFGYLPIVLFVYGHSPGPRAIPLSSTPRVPIHELTVSNFKGISDRTTIPIRPITLFIGPNSSGKSTCIHAMAALAQTAKLSSDPRPLVLDDELAQVHLGRFIEVIHSKSYSDAIELGVGVGPVNYTEPTNDAKGRMRFRKHSDSLSALYRFTCTKRTQEVRLDQATFSLGKKRFVARRTKDQYDIRGPASAGTARLARAGGLDVEWSSLMGTEQSSVNEILVLEQVQRSLSSELRKTCYLGPFRQAPQRRYPTRGASPAEVGAQGEATITMLANEVVQSGSRTHIRQIAGWLKMLRLGKDLDVDRVGSSDLFGVDITLNDDVSLPIADLGYGLSQVLPVLTQCSFAPDGSTILFEQPELHLHRVAAKPLAKVFIQTARSRGAHIVAETHSPDLLFQVVQELREGNITLDEVALYRVSRDQGRTVVAHLDIDPETFDVYGTWDHGLTVDIPT